MSSPLPSGEQLERLQAEVEARLDAGQPLAPEELAASLGLAPDLVERCAAGYRALVGAVAPPPLRLPEQYVDRVELARGGMGVVYRARDPELGREVAIKVLQAGADASPRELERFRREALATARLSHPNLVRIHEAGFAGDRPFLVMELVEGARTIDRAAPELGWRERVALVRDAARALGCAHRAGILHRDVKAQNLLVDADGRVRVTDFGLAREDAAEALTRTGTVLGTFGYMAPEQARGDVRAQGSPVDVWGLGVVLYELLAGRRPFPDGTLQEYFEALARRAAPPSLRALNPDVPRGLEAVSSRALAFAPEDRYPDGDALADDLDAVLAGERPDAAGSGRPARATLALLCALGLVLTAGVARRALRLGRAAPGPAVTQSPSADGVPAPADGATQPPGRAGSQPPGADVDPWEQAGGVDGGPGEQLRVAWRWLREDPRGPRAERARAFLAREGRREPLLRVRHLTGSGASLIRVAFTGDGAGLLTFGPAGLARWDLASGLGERFVAPGFVRRAARAPNGAWALGGEHRVDWLPAEALAAPEPGRPLRRLARWSRPAPRPLALAISPDGARVAVGLEEEGLLVLRAADGAPEGPVELPGAGRVSDVAFLDERRLVAAWTGPGASTSVLLGWDSEAGARWVEVTTRRVTAFALSADRTAVATGSALGDATLFDAASLEVRATLRDPALRGASLLTPGLFRTAVRDLAFSGERLLAVPAEGGPLDERRLKAIDPGSGEVQVLTPPLTAAPAYLAVSPDGSLAAIGGRDGSAEVWVVGAAGER